MTFRDDFVITQRPKGNVTAMLARTSFLRRLSIVTALFAVGLAAACAESTDLAGDVPGPPREVPVFVGQDSSTEAAVSPDASTRMCIATECPAPYATCPETEATGPVYKCQSNLLADNNNCGACGNVCQVFYQFEAATSCVNGTCVAACNGERYDCDGIPDNGCETNVLEDVENCGTCGKKCAPGDRCINGHCGCPSGQADCDGKCVNTKTDPENCGVCGNVCEPPADASAPPPNMEYTCVAGTCGKLDCLREDGSKWTDCNHLVQADGCEVNLAVSDTKNCGACGNVCNPGQRCEIVDYSTAPATYACVCKPNETMCGEDMLPGFFAGCADLLSSVTNCGACGHSCPLGVLGQIASCRLGVCETTCLLGLGDCNGDPSDGCETNLLVNQAHCGACGTRCDAAGGQPCVEGRCLVSECDAGATTK